MWSLAPAMRAIWGSSWASEPSLACHVPIVQGNPAKGKGLDWPCAAMVANCHSRQKRIPPEIPRIRQVTAIQAQGDMTARVVAVRRGASADALIKGRTDIDVMMVIGTFLQDVRGTRSQTDPGTFAQPLIQIDYSGLIFPGQQPGCGGDVPIWR